MSSGVVFDSKAALASLKSGTGYSDLGEVSDPLTAFLLFWLLYEIDESPRVGRNTERRIERFVKVDSMAIIGSYRDL